jgi:uncharacterized protein (TIGR02453 family)
MLQPYTLNFLRELKKNNNRDWFNANREGYDKARADFEDFISRLLSLLQKDEPDFAGLEPKDCLFRIYRDVRFSANKDPYKTNFAASIKKGGRRSPYCGLYVHIEPSGGWGSFVAGGFWMPEAPLLKKIRQEIEYNHEEFDSILTSRSFKKYFSGMEEQMLKRFPKGVDPDHPAATYMKYTSFIASHDLDPSSKTLLKECADAYRALKPFTGFLNRSLD